MDYIVEPMVDSCCKVVFKIGKNCEVFVEDSWDAVEILGIETCNALKLFPRCCGFLSDWEFAKGSYF